MAATAFTIGRLASAAGVGVETIRYYQRRGLLPVPEQGAGAFRHYPRALAGRVRFIRRSQDLGFTLEEVAQLLRLEDGMRREEVQAVARVRLAGIRQRIEALRQMEGALAQLLRECEQGGSACCPIIAALHFDAPDAPAYTSTP